jgi:excisionase family DNA binding protein
MRSELEDIDVEKITEKLFDKLKSYLCRPASNSADDAVMDVKGLCAYLKVTEKWVYEQTHVKAIPHYKLTNKVLRFRRSDVDKWLERLRTPALADPTGKIRILK